ncbi:exonuclease domain-containing protein [Cellulosimicrobium marinum]|uniref:exonuclease domain-containing protein n=1 Tax=Cellulosimicrobium marinum TaxID=1638992 RepID=UPI001E4A7E01|nr:exonuclease domain-containing protein [Cellulosimicrobium marinum]MCB7136716.1 DNA polymerase III subunit epsilon [Cellulosimicrobium marinum]
MTWTAGPLVAFDTETTGLDVDVDRVVTAAVVVRGHRGTTTRTWLLDPGVGIPPEAAAIHGISTAHAAAHGTAPRVALDEVAGLLVAHQRAGTPLVAYNAAFDLMLLEVELARHGLPTLHERLGRPVRPVLDPLVLDRAADGSREGKRRLADLCVHYGVPVPAGLHTAEVDARTTLDLLDGLVRAHPDLAAASADALHDHQVGSHRRWVDELAERPREQPYVGAGADGRWPV